MEPNGRADILHGGFIFVAHIFEPIRFQEPRGFIQEYGINNYAG